MFVRNEAASRNVLIEPALRHDRSVRVGAAAAALYMASVGSEFYLLTVLLQAVRHYSPLGAGLAFLPLAIMVTAGSAVAGRAVRRTSPPVVLTAGFLIALVGLLCSRASDEAAQSTATNETATKDEKSGSFHAESPGFDRVSAIIRRALYLSRSVRSGKAGSTSRRPSAARRLRSGRRSSPGRCGR